MMAHQPHLLDFSPPPNTVMAIEEPSPFDHGLVALHDDSDMRGIAHRDLTADTTPWPSHVSLSLYNTRGGSLADHQLFAAPPVVPSPPPSCALQPPFQLRTSKYLASVKELLREFCSLGGELHSMNGIKKASKTGKWDDVEASSSSSPWGNPSLCSMDVLELERRKARLLSMVEEVDRRYRRYREQMRAVELSFEAVAGGGSAQVYTTLALRAMSRHFRCLRDAIVAQVRAARKAMGERDGGGGVAAPGASKGDTPRLRVLDQCLRQQRAFQQSGAIESFPWRPQRGLPERAVTVLRAWLFEHFLHPYPNDVDKHILARQTGLSRSQVSNWFINARVRLWKPMIEDIYKEEMKQSNAASNQNPNSSNTTTNHDRKNTAAASTTTIAQSHHLRPPVTSHSLISSIVSPDGCDQFHGGYHRNLHGGGVSLTLGLHHQQQPFVASMMHHQAPSLMLQGEEEEAVLPYRDLMGSQLLHDLAG